MTENFIFCNRNFLELYCYRPWSFYNSFLLEEQTKALIDSMGVHPDLHIIFKYNPEKRIRATFIVFDGDLRDMDVKCICVLFHGDRFVNYCYFYEVYEDLSIGCVQVAQGQMSDRIVWELNVGNNIDDYFDKLCSTFGNPIYETTTMLYYKESDDCFRLLDMILTELPGRCDPLLGGDPIVESKTINGTEFLFYKSMVDNSYLVARTIDGQNPVDILLEDVKVL